MKRLVLLCILLLSPLPAAAQTYLPPANPAPPEASAERGGVMTMTDTAFRQGIVGGAWVGFVLNYAGGNGGAFDGRVYILRPGGNGAELIDGGVVKAAGDGDRMDAFFAAGKLYVTNEIYLPGEAHCCGSKTVVQVFGIDKDANELVLLTTKNVATGATQKQMIEATNVSGK